jgi:hypothetical protein
MTIASACSKPANLAAFRLSAGRRRQVKRLSAPRNDATQKERL